MLLSSLWYTILYFVKILIYFLFLGVGLLDGEVKLNSSFEVIKTKFVNLCVAFKIETEPVCAGFFDVFGPEVLPAYRASDLG